MGLIDFMLFSCISLLWILSTINTIEADRRMDEMTKKIDAFIEKHGIEL